MENFITQIYIKFKNSNFKVIQQVKISGILRNLIGDHIIMHQ